MRAQKPNKSGHEYECNHTIEYTTVVKFVSSGKAWNHQGTQEVAAEQENRACLTEDRHETL